MLQYVACLTALVLAVIHIWINERKTKSPFVVFSLISVKQPVHVDICNWGTFRTSASMHTVMHLIVHLVWETRLRERSELVWPVRTSKLVFSAEEQNSQWFVPPVAQITETGKHTWWWCCCCPSAGQDGHEHKRGDNTLELQSPSFLQAWRLEDQREGKLAVKIALWYFEVSHFTPVFAVF